MTSRAKIDALAKREILDRLIAIIESQPEKDADNLWCELSGSVFLSYDVVRQYPDKPWDWSMMRDNIDVSDALHDLDRPWDWCRLSQRATRADVIGHPDAPWSWHDLSDEAKGIDAIANAVEMIENMKDGVMKLDFYNLSSRLNIDFIWAHDMLPWCDESLSRNPSLRFSDVVAHPDVAWDWAAVSENQSITFDEILSAVDLPWCWKALSARTDVTMSVFNKYMRHFDFTILSEVASMEMIMAGRERGRRWYGPGLCKNEKLSAADLIECFLHGMIDKYDVCGVILPREVYYYDNIVFDCGPMSGNGNFLIREILEFGGYVDVYRLIGANGLGRERELAFGRHARRHLAALRIQHAWRTGRRDPAFGLCHRTQVAAL